MNIEKIKEQYTEKLTKEVLNDELEKAKKGLVLSLIQENFYQNKEATGEDKVNSEQNLMVVNRNLKHLTAWVKFLEDNLKTITR
jgi:hypothetical protein